MGIRAVALAAAVIAACACRAGEVETMSHDLPSPDERAALPPDGGDQFNRLIFESSPYLLQHARNPVDWRPWGDEALELARELDRPVFLSVGYSTCHWCHVMERESFEDERIAAVLNAQFIPIKVDREERPDLDEIYMTATQLVTGRGGWPNSVWLTPDGRPWYAGTYFPPEGRRGMPGFRDLLEGLAETWQTRRAEVEAQANQLQDAIRQSALPHETAPVPLTEGLLTGAVEALSDRYDGRYGGFGGAPKFPPHASLRLLLFMQATGRLDEHSWAMATETLDAMARGGIHDHVGGGFHRYSTDAWWLVPHFEKMLYDNGQLARVYAEAFAETGRAEYDVVTRGICDWVLREMTDPEGGFYSALDADSEGVEGKFYLWSREEVIEVIGGEPGALACDLFNVREDGNFVDEVTGERSEANILHLGLRGLADDDLWPFVQQVKARLLERRAGRVRPHLDDKVLAEWNGLMIGGMAAAGRVLGEPRYIEAATRAAEFVLTQMRREGRLLRVWREGSAKQPAYLDDYAAVAEGLLELHRATGEQRWLDEAASLADQVLALFEDGRSGGFFLTSEEHEDLLARTKEPYDQAVPSGNGMAALTFARLADLTGDARYREAAGRTLRAFSAAMQNAPSATGTLLLGTGHYLAASEDAVAAPVEQVEALDDPDTRAQRGVLTAEAWASARTAPPGAEVAVAVRITVEAGWHINSHEPLQEHLLPTSVDLAEGPHLIAEVSYPEPVEVTQAFSDEPLAVYEGEAWLLVRLRVTEGAAGNAPLRLAISAQPCDDTSCARPERLLLELPLRIAEDAAEEQRHEAAFARFDR
ncbi:MAG: DUF255 domain-containing protein [candidate division WS1 bacterium]|jgi:uncharacterized protein YyaL (SSP411 family)|nr:DUF255 domain-containing protein [candidate division WS1 bacterium]